MNRGVDMLRSKVARWIIALFFFSAFLPTAAVVFFSFAEVTDHLFDQASERLREASKSAGLAIVERARLLEEELALVARALETESAHLSTWSDDAPPRGFEAIGLVDADGATRPLLGEVGSVPPLGRDALDHLGSGHTHITTDFRFDPPRIYMLSALGSHPQTLIAGRVRLRYLLGITDEPTLETRTRLCVLQEGRAIFCALPTGPPDSAELWDGSQPLHLGSGADELQFVAGYWKLFLMGPFLTPEWTIMIAEPKAEVLRPIHAFRRQFPLVVAGVLLLVLLLSMTQIRRSLVPLVELRRATRRVAAGDFETQVSISSGDEFQELGDSFNSMAGRLRTQFEALSSMAESERTLRERAEAATRSKTEFLANMSHEIRTPMTAILGFAELMLDPSLSSEEHSEAVRTITRSGEHLVGLIDEILEISRAESVGVELDLTEFDPVEVAAEVVTLLRGQAAEKGLALEVVRRGQAVEGIRSDRRRLRQILINLVGNAVKFTERGGVQVVIGADPDSPDLRRLRISVVDTGIGIPQAVQPLVFSPFWQADSSTTRAFGGTGLGLSVARSLSDLLGGSLSLLSAEGRGSTFTLILGADPGVGAPPAESPPPPSAAHPGLRGATALLAEDCPDNQRLLGYILEKAGVRVEIVENGRLACERGLERLQADEPYDVILMDMQMPVMDGYEATQRLRREGYGGPIIALTAHALSYDRDRCLGAGCDAYATKPIQRQQLLDLVAGFLDKPR